MSCVFAVKVGMSQIVQVVSMLEVMMSFGDSVFQSSDVSGAVCSGVFELESSARGCSLGVALFSLVADALRVMELLTFSGPCVEFGNDHSRRWSPEVAMRSVDCFEDEGGSQEMRVTG